MFCPISDRVREEIMERVHAAKAQHGIVNVTAILDAIFDPRGTHVGARQELEETILNFALHEGCAVEFGRSSEINAVPEGYTLFEIEIIPEPTTTM